MLVFEHDAKPGEPICGSGLYRRFAQRQQSGRAFPCCACTTCATRSGRRRSAAFKIYEVQRMMGHRHITTTERYLHYAPDPMLQPSSPALWETAVAETPLPGPAEAVNVVPLHRAA